MPCKCNTIYWGVPTNDFFLNVHDEYVSFISMQSPLLLYDWSYPGKRDLRTAIQLEMSWSRVTVCGKQRNSTHTLEGKWNHKWTHAMCTDVVLQHGQALKAIWSLRTQFNAIWKWSVYFVSLLDACMGGFNGQPKDINKEQVLLCILWNLSFNTSWMILYVAGWMQFHISWGYGVGSFTNWHCNRWKCTLFEQWQNSLFAPI